MEIRSFTEPLELRADESGAKTITGYAAVFNTNSVEMGLFEPFHEQIAPGAFKRTLKDQPDVRALLDHDTGRIVGRTKAGSLLLSEDEKGLKFTLSPADTVDGRTALAWVQDGLVDAMSFGFIPRTVDWSLQNGKHLRTVKDLDLYEVSLVVFAHLH